MLYSLEQSSAVDQYQLHVDHFQGKSKDGQTSNIYGGKGQQSRTQQALTQTLNSTHSCNILQEFSSIIEGLGRPVALIFLMQSGGAGTDIVPQLKPVWEKFGDGTVPASGTLEPTGVAQGIAKKQCDGLSGSLESNGRGMKGVEDRSMYFLKKLKAPSSFRGLVVFDHSKMMPLSTIDKFVLVGKFSYVILSTTMIDKALSGIGFLVDMN